MPLRVYVSLCQKTGLTLAIKGALQATLQIHASVAGSSDLRAWSGPVYRPPMEPAYMMSWAGGGEAPNRLMVTLKKLKRRTMPADTRRRPAVWRRASLYICQREMTSGGKLMKLSLAGSAWWWLIRVRHS